MTASNPENGHTRTRAFPTIRQALLLLGLLLLLQVGASAVVGAYVTLRSMSAPGMAAMLGIVSVATFGATCILGAGWSRVPARRLFYLRGFPLIQVPPLLAMTLGLIIVISELDNVLQRFLPVPDWFTEMLAELGLGQGFALGTFIVLVIVAPLTEEPLFRGILLHGFARNYGAGWAIFGTALLFGAIHLNPWQFVGAFLLGLAFGWWTVRTGSILPALLGHALNNGMVVFAADVLQTEIQGFNAWEEGVHAHQPWWFTLTGVALLLAGGAILHRMWSRVPSPWGSGLG